MSLVLHNTQFHCFRDRVIAIFLCLLFSQAILWSPLQTDATLLDVPCCVRLHVAWGPVKSCVAPLLCRTYVVCVPVNFFLAAASRFASRVRELRYDYFFIFQKNVSVIDSMSFHFLGLSCCRGNWISQRLTSVEPEESIEPHQVSYH